MRPFVQETLALSRRWLLRQRREAGTLVFGLLQPVLWLLLFGQMFDRVAQWRPAVFGTDRYLTFQAAGMVAFTVLGNSLMGAVPVLFDRENGVLDKLLAMPISRASLMVSRFVYVVGLSMVQALLVLVLAALMGVKVASGLPGVIGVLAASALLCLGFTFLSIALAFVFPGHAAFFGVVGLVMTPLLFLSDALMPLDMMPGWMRVIALSNPLTHAVDVMRALVIGPASAAVIVRGVAVLTVFDLLMLAMALRVIRRRVE